MKMNMCRTLLLVGIVLMISMGCNRKTSSGSSRSKLDSNHEFGFVQADNLTEVIDFATAEGKLVFLDVYTDWCLPCKMMDEDVFSDQRLGTFFKEHFVSYKVNAEKGKGPDIAALYQVPGYPTLLFLDTKGRVLVKKVGVAYHEEMYNLAESAIAKAGVEGS